jgi:hypothetical protein
MTTTRQRKSTAIDRIADRIDLAIDLMTLGQYGLERVPADDAGERCGSRSGAWEASRPARRRGAECEWDFPSRCGARA